MCSVSEQTSNFYEAIYQPDNQKLGALLMDYINSNDLATEELKMEMHGTEVGVRKMLLMKEIYQRYQSRRMAVTCVSVAAYLHDLEALKSMIQGLAAEDKFEVLRNSRAVYWAIFDKGSYTTSYSTLDVVDYLFRDLSSEQRLDLMSYTNVDLFYTRAFQNNASIREFILKSLSNAHQLQLLMSSAENQPKVSEVFPSSPHVDERVREHFKVKTDKRLMARRVLTGMVAKIKKQRKDLQERRKSYRQRQVLEMEKLTAQLKQLEM